MDDAAGEAFDKSAKLMGLPYPGGPHLSRLAESGRADAFDLPRPMLHSGNLEFSFSGLKTAVRTQLQKLGLLDDEAALAQALAEGGGGVLADLAASAQAARGQADAAAY